MELGEAGLQQQPFRAQGEPLALSSHAAYRIAEQFLADTYHHKHGVGVLQGPTLAGKSTLLRQFRNNLGADVYTTITDARSLTREDLLKSILKQFGYPLELKSVNELLSMVRVVSMQRAAAGNPPLLIIENSHLLDADILALLCELTDFKASRQSAIRLILSCQRNIEGLSGAPDTASMAERVTGVHRLRPMVLLETRDYLHAKLYAAGAMAPASLFPENVCVDIHMASGGWPGIVDRLALFALAKAESAPITPGLVERRQLPDDMRFDPDIVSDPADAEQVESLPMLLVTRRGDFLKEVRISRARLLIGRSGHNDLSIDSKFVSRNHALIVSAGSSTLLMDLNSTNGTFVNSRRVSNHVMRHDDIISLGSYRLKFVHPSADKHFELDESGLAETVIMKTLDDMRHMLSGESTQTMPQKALDRLVNR